MTGRGRGNWEITHGGARRCGRDPEYLVWHKMLRRCRDPREQCYPHYGGRGITVCERWQSYANFREDMGPRPSKRYSIERVDNEAGYHPENCIWATRDVQAKNRRKPKRRSTCLRGHALEGDNLYVRSGGKRGCKACRRRNMADFYFRKSHGAHHVD